MFFESGKSLTLVGGPFPSSAASLWLRSFPAPRWRSNQRQEFVPAALAEAQIANHAPNKNLQRLLHPLDSRQLRAAVGPDLVVTAVRDSEELKRHLITGKDASPVPNGLVFVGFDEIQPPAVLIHSDPGLHSELERLQLQTRLQIPVAGQLGCCVLPLSFRDNSVVEQCLLISTQRSRSSSLDSMLPSGLDLCGYRVSLLIGRGPAGA